MRAFQGKRPRTGHRVRTAAGGALCSGVAIALAVAACTASPGTAAPSATPVSGAPSAASSARQAVAAGGSGNLAAGSAAAAPGSVASCTGAPLKAQLAAAVLAGGSLIVATGTPTGRSVTGNPAAAGTPAFYAMTLTAVQTLRGPAVASGSTAWVEGPAHGTAATPENSALLAPGGRLFAIAWPQAATHDLVGPLLQLAPVVGADVVFTPYACWNLTGLVPDQYQAAAPLRPVPGGANYGGTHQEAENGLYTVPLATVRHIAAAA